MRVVRIVGTRRRHSSLRELIDILMGACFGRFMGETQAEEWERKQRKLEKKRAKDEQCKRDNEILKAVVQGEVRDLIGSVPVLQNFIERRSGRKITARTKEEKMRDHEAAQRIGKPVEGPRPN